MSKLTQFQAAVGALAQRAGIQVVVIAAQDPDTKEIGVAAAPGAMDVVRETVATKFNLIDPTTEEVGWGRD